MIDTEKLEAAWDETCTEEPNWMIGQKHAPKIMLLWIGAEIARLCTLANHTPSEVDRDTPLVLSAYEVQMFLINSLEMGIRVGFHYANKLHGDSCFQEVRE